MPFNTPQETDPAYGRQLAYLLGEALKSFPDVDVQNIAYVARFRQEGSERRAFVGMMRELEDTEWPRQVLRQTESDFAIDGYFALGEPYTLQLRITKAGEEEAVALRSYGPEPEQFVGAVRTMMGDALEALGLVANEQFEAATGGFGTKDPEAFLAVLAGWDVLAQLKQAGEHLPPSFSVEKPLDGLVEALKRDPDFVAPYEALVALVRESANRGLMPPEELERRVLAATVLVEEDWRGWYVLGDLRQRSNRASDAAAAFERALSLNAAEAAVWVRLGMVQMALGNTEEAEKSLREALTREGNHEEKTAAPYLATLMFQQGREQEAVELWRDLRDADPAVAGNWCHLAMALEHTGDKEAARRTFEEGLEKASDKPKVHSFYAAFLKREGDAKGTLEHLEQAVPYMPYDHNLMAEYAQALHANGKTDELKDVLRQILEANPPPDLKAQASAWQMEMEQPEKLQRFLELGERMQEGDAQEAVSELEQLSRWLPDYWKIWLALAHGYNETGDFEKAERAARRLLAMYPGCEAAYGEVAGSLFKQERAEEAYKLLRLAARKYPQYLTVTGNLGMAAKLTGRQEEAEKIAEGLRQLSDRFPAVRELIEKIEEGPQTGPAP
jgi:Flp pilus assembly protein TadD